MLLLKATAMAEPTSEGGKTVRALGRIALRTRAYAEAGPSAAQRPSGWATLRTQARPAPWIKVTKAASKVLLCATRASLSGVHFSK